MFAARLLPSMVMAAVLPLFGHVQAAQQTTRLVHVSGEGLVRVVPDEVVIDVTITTVDDDLIRVRSQSDAQAQAVLDLTKKHGAGEDGFEVTRLELSLDYSEQLRRQIYEVERDVVIKLHELPRLDALLSDLLRVPDSKILGISFGAAEGRRLQFVALGRAVDDAKEKAAHLARLHELTLGKPLDIRVVSEHQAPFVMSVVPVVGAVEEGTQRRAASDGRQTGNGGPEQRCAAPSLPLRSVSFQAPRKPVREDTETAQKAAPFALGLIEITAAVEIDFELTE